ncbi:MAG: aldehyde dehydrogenase EutE [Candidatus Riflebacteria bacterium]|nr:aldehyde dehydrogenase EutE [Candidatus Riflebacteria bacterium]
MEVTPEQIQSIVKEVLEKVRKGQSGGQAAAAAPGKAPPPAAARVSEAWAGREGSLPDVNTCVTEAQRAFETLIKLPLATRKEIVQNMRARFVENLEQLSAHAVQETGMGRAADKVEKNRLAATKTPGIEDVEPKVVTGDDGLTLIERRPWGVITAVTPCTNPTETIVCNALGMVAAGNSVVFNPHPRAKRVSQAAVSLLARAIMEAGGPPNLLTVPSEPSIETTNQAMNHPGVKMVVVTGGGDVVKAAFRTGKKAITAGPGNPPVVVDETADLAQAARHIVEGASLDNTVLCIAEKEIIAVEKIADELLERLKEAGAYQVIGSAVGRLEKLILHDGHVNRDLVGRDVQVILAQIGLEVAPHYRLAIFEAPVDHPLIFAEQLMPVLPFVRVKDVTEAIELAYKAEKGCGHTAEMHSKNLDNLHAMARRMNTAIFVKNGPSCAGLGAGGEGWTSFSIAHPTGEGLTTARHFTREIRCTLKGYFRIV